MTRPETGLMQFDDDWCGIFIRGDNALAYAMHIDNLLGQIERLGIKVHPHGLKGLSKLLHSCQQGSVKSPQLAVLSQVPMIEHLDDLCGKQE